MSTLSDYIKSHPEKTMSAMADELGVSRPYLYGLCDGTRSPSFDVAKRIEANTGGMVAVTSWPKFKFIFAQMGGGAS